jgi:hypothetical protein
MKQISSFLEKKENDGEKSLDLDNLSESVREPFDFEREKRGFSRKRLILCKIGEFSWECPIVMMIILIFSYIHVVGGFCFVDLGCY